MGKEARLGKEAKIGLAVIVVLVTSFGGALGYRLWKNRAEAAETETGSGKPEKLRPILASGPSKATLITPSENSRRAEPEDRYSRRRGEIAGSEKSIVDEFEKKSPPPETEPRTVYMPDVNATRSDEHQGHGHHKTEEVMVSEPAGAGVRVVETSNEPAHDPFKHNHPGEHGNPPASIEHSAAAPMTVNPVVYPQEAHPQQGGYNPLRAHDSRLPHTPPAAPEHHLHAGESYQSHLQGGPAPTNGHLNTAAPNGYREPVNHGHEHLGTNQPLAEHHPAGMNPLAPENLFHQKGSEHLHQPGETYRVLPNESYWVISQKTYGTGGYFKALAEHNRDRYPRPDQIQVGDIVSVPSAATLAQAYPDLCPRPRQRPPGDGIMRNASSREHLAAGGRAYKVREGDTLFDIARHELGKASRWAEIYELNRHHLGDDFDYLAPGTELILPGQGTSSDPLTTRRSTLPPR
jgi:hypothetical protein